MLIEAIKFKHDRCKKFRKKNIAIGYHLSCFISELHQFLVDFLIRRFRQSVFLCIPKHTLQVTENYGIVRLVLSTTMV